LATDGATTKVLADLFVLLGQLGNWSVRGRQLDRFHEHDTTVTDKRPSTNV
jgi:hypothetical protein